jgi:hypothetical protein
MGIMTNFKRITSDLAAALIGWFGLHIALFIILLNHQDNTPVFGTFSAGYAAYLGLVVLVGVAGGAFILTRSLIRIPQTVIALRANNFVRAVALTLGTLVLLWIWLTPFNNIFLTSVQRETIRAWDTLVVLSTMYLGLFWRAKDTETSWAAWLTVALTAGAAVVILAVHFLDRFPQINLIDELHNWSVQWTFANTGLLGDTLYRQMIPLPQPIYDSPHYIAGFLLRFFGDQFWQARFTRMLLTVLALPFIYLSGKRMYGPRTGLLAVVFALFLIVPVAYVRPDFFVGVMLSVAIYVYLRAQTTRRPWLHYLAGLCVAVAGEGHPLAYRFGLTFALLYGLRWLYEMWKTRRLFIDGRVFALGLGGLTGMMIYLSIHILPGLDQGLHFAKNYSPIGRTIQDQIDAALGMVQQQLDIWISSSPFEFIFVIVGAAWAIVKFEDSDKLLLALLFVSEGLMLTTYGYYRPFYQVHFLPIFALLAGRVVANLTDSLEQSRSRRGPGSRLALAGVIFLVGFVIMEQNAVAQAPDPLRDDYTQIAKTMKTDLPSDKIIVGNEDYFLEMRSPNYYGIETVTTDNWFKVNYQGYELWQVTKPDIFVITPALDTPKYIDWDSIWQYMGDYNFTAVRCYVGNHGLVEARVYASPNAGMVPDGSCPDTNSVVPGFRSTLVLKTIPFGKSH